MWPATAIVRPPAAAATEWRPPPPGSQASHRGRYQLRSPSIAIAAGRPASIDDGSGNVTLRGLSGRLLVSDGAGNINGSAMTGPVNFEDGSGDIVVEGLASADVTASDDSGNITLTFTKVPDRIHVSDGSGDVTLVLPRGGTLYRVSATASAGNSAVSVRTSSVSQHVISVTDGSGNISIRY